MSNLEDNAPDLERYAFPHLDDTQFPKLENVDVYQYDNEFDYDRWNDAHTKLHLCNVLWNNDYSNVVKFETNEKRDKFFDELGAYKVDLETAFDVAPKTTVKVPVPYQVATRFNYMYVDLPIMTSEEVPINYEDERRTQRFYYFINDVMQNAPSSTLLMVELDSWTTYINNVDIPFLMLERGHQPMSAIDVETYLSNPAKNNSLLLAPDVNFSETDGVVKNATFVPVNNGSKYIIFATTMNQTQLQQQTYPTSLSKTNTPATFANSTARNGYQYIVNDYDWGLGDYDYNGMYTETDSFQSSDGSIPNNMTMVAVPAANADSLFAYLSEVVPFIYKTIKACFMVDDNMFELGSPFEFCNTVCYFVKPTDSKVLTELKLSKTDFGYDAKYEKITKLYTSPYARIEVTDNNGDSREFKIENSSKVEVNLATAIAFPFITMQVYLTGINGSGYSTYSWKKLDGSASTRKMFTDDFGDYIWNWDIPTYALYVRGYDDYKASNYPQQFVNRYNAIADYHKTVGMDNTQYENAKDAANTTQTMTNNSANAENTNAVNSANTIYTNNVASANTAHSNAYASANTARTNTYNQANTLIANNAIDCARNSYNNSEKVSLNSSINTNSADKINADATDANYVTAVNTQIENQQSIATATVNQVGALSAGISGAASHVGVGNLVGAVGSLVDAAISAINAGTSSYIATTANTDQASAAIEQTRNGAKNAIAVNYSDSSNSNVTANRITNKNNDAATSITANTATTMKTNADNTNATEKANADRTQSTSNANSQRTKDTSIDNANRTKDNAINNAALNRNTSVANSGYLRENAVDNAKITLEQKRIANQQQYYSSRLSAPTQYGADSGDPTLDAFQRRGLQVKVRTQADGDIAQAGDLMLRYGYALNQVVNVQNTGLCCMANFTYWKAADIWINEGEGVNQNAQRDIQRAFENGVTVWKDPNKVGKVSIYDNWD